MAASLPIECEQGMINHGQFIRYDLRRPFRCCRGSTALEIIIALFLLATLAVISGQIVVSVVQTRVEQRKRAYALLEAGNIMEEVFLLPWTELGPGQSRDWPCSQAAKQVLKNPRVILLTQPTDDENTRRLVINVEWSVGRDQAPQRVQLVAFRHRSQGAAGGTAVTRAKRNEPGIPAGLEKES